MRVIYILQQNMEVVLSFFQHRAYALFASECHVNKKGGIRPVGHPRQETPTPDSAHFIPSVLMSTRFGSAYYNTSPNQISTQLTRPDPRPFFDDERSFC